MKVPELLLGAMLLGITVETTSCSKKNHEATPFNPTEQVNNDPQNQPQPTDCCPACGMG